MLKLEDNLLKIDLQEGKSQDELVELLIKELSNTFLEKMYGLEMNIFGRLTTGMAIVLGHKLAHICKSVSIYDPKQDKYVKVIWH